MQWKGFISILPVKAFCKRGKAKDTTDCGCEEWRYLSYLKNKYCAASRNNGFIYTFMLYHIKCVLNTPPHLQAINSNIRSCHWLVSIEICGSLILKI